MFTSNTEMSDVPSSIFNFSATQSRPTSKGKHEVGRRGERRLGRERRIRDKRYLVVVGWLLVGSCCWLFLVVGCFLLLVVSCCWLFLGVSCWWLVVGCCLLVVVGWWCWLLLLLFAGESYPGEGDRVERGKTSVLILFLVCFSVSRWGL